MKIAIIDRTNEDKYEGYTGYTLNNLSIYDCGELNIDFNAEYIEIGADSLMFYKVCSDYEEIYLQEAEQIKNNTPIKTYVIAQGKLFYGLLESVALCCDGILDLGANSVGAKYNILKVYDVSNTPLNIKLNIIDVPDCGISEDVIERTIKAGTLIKEYT